MGPMIDTSRLVFSTTTTGDSAIATASSITACSNGTYTRDCTGITNLTISSEDLLSLSNLNKINNKSNTELKATEILTEVAKKAIADTDFKGYKYHRYSSYIPKRIIYNDPATVVFWKDGTKTVVKRAPNEVSNHYTAFCAALAKKIFETNSHVNRIVKSGECIEKKTVVKKQEEKKPEPKKLTAKKPVAKKQTDKKKK